MKEESERHGRLWVPTEAWQNIKSCTVVQSSAENTEQPVKNTGIVRRQCGTDLLGCQNLRQFRR